MSDELMEAVGFPDARNVLDNSEGLFTPFFFFAKNTSPIMKVTIK
jgi:hypothetical protein